KLLKTGSEIIVESLKNEGVSCVFGMPGAQNLALYDSLAGSGIRNILVTNEQNAPYMADGYSRATGKVGVCIVVGGPGLTHMLSGLAEANADSSPLVVLAMSIGSAKGDFFIHQVKQLEAARPIVKQVIRIRHGDTISRRIKEAFYVAQEAGPGPVIVEVSKEVLSEKSQKETTGEKAGEKSALDSGVKEKIEQLASKIINAKHCGIYAGMGAFGASGLIRQIAEKFSMPVATTISGRGVFPEDHELSVGFGFGPSGTEISEEVFKECDVILAFGCRFSEMSTGQWGMRISAWLAHIDKDKSVFNKNYPAQMALCADTQLVLVSLLDILKDAKRQKDISLMQKIKRGKEGQQGAVNKFNSADKGVLPSIFFQRLRKSLSRESILVTDCGNHQLWAVSDFQVFEPRTFITPTDYQAMGFGIPAAIGAKIGRSDRKVVCVCGDGGFLMSGFETLTAVREKLGIVIFVFNDAALGLIKDLQEKLYGRANCVKLVNPDYRFLAQALGVDYHGVKNEEELEQFCLKSMDYPGPMLVEVKVNYESLPRYAIGIKETFWKRASLRKKLTLALRNACVFRRKEV
ncbi:MAG: thiamine pyrophosphate-binding protein, partial [Candidatus Omnitrophota bacterium]